MGFLDLFKGEEEPDKKETYVIRVYCLNCKGINKAHINEEIPVKKALETEKCLYCKIPLLVQWSANVERIKVGQDDGEDEAYTDVNVIESINWENVPDKIKKLYSR